MKLMQKYLGFFLGFFILILVGNMSFADEIKATGKFTNTITKGHVSLIKKDDSWYLRLEEDFIHDGSPDPWIAFGKDGFQRHGIIGELKNHSGSQDFLINEKLDPTQFNEVYVWCVQHNTSLGRAQLEWQ